MTLTIHLPDEQQAALDAKARALGVLRKNTFARLWRRNLGLVPVPAATSPKSSLRI